MSAGAADIPPYALVSEADTIAIERRGPDETP